MSDEPDEKLEIGKKRSFTHQDAHIVMAEIATQMEVSTKAWVGYGEGRVVILKDSYKGFKTYYHYEDGVFRFLDGKGGEQKVCIEEITEIEGF